LDREPIARLDDDGQVLSSIPTGSVPGQLLGIGEVHVYPDGRILVVDDGRQTVYGLSPDGRRRWQTSIKEKGRRRAILSELSLRVFSTGGFELSSFSSGERWRFAEDGRALGKTSSEHRAQWRHKLDRCPNGDWMTGHRERKLVAPDGRFVMVEERPRPADASSLRIAWYDSKGKPEGMGSLPAKPRYEFAAFDGNLLYGLRSGEIVAFDRSGWPTGRLPITGVSSWTSVFPSRGGLAVFDHRKLIVWYASPPRR